MALQIGAVAPDFTADSTEGKLHFYDWAGDNWVLLFSHPKDFTPVCTTELGAVAKLKPEFDKRGVKVMGLSVDPGDQSREMVRRHRGDARCGPQLSHDRRHRPQSLQALRHAAGRRPPATSEAARPPITTRCAMSSSLAPTRRSSWCWSIR